MPSRSKTRCLLCRISTMSPLPSQLSWTRPNLRTGYTPFSFFACCMSGGMTARTVQALTASEKKMIFNIKRRGEAYRRKDDTLAAYSKWLRFEEGPNGKWHCACCHAHPSLRHPQDKLANHRAPVLQFAYFKKHAESDCHRVVMAAVAQQSAGNAIPQHITVTAIDVLLRRTIESIAWVQLHTLPKSLLALLMSLQRTNGATSGAHSCTSHRVQQGCRCCSIRCFRDTELIEMEPKFEQKSSLNCLS